MKRIAALSLIAAMAATTVSAQDIKPVVSSQSLGPVALGSLGANAGALVAAFVAVVGIAVIATSDNTSGT